MGQSIHCCARPNRRTHTLTRVKFQYRMSRKTDTLENDSRTEQIFRIPSTRRQVRRGKISWELRPGIVVSTVKSSAKAGYSSCIHGGQAGGINDGDLAVIRQTATASNSDTVVAIVVGRRSNAETIRKAKEQGHTEASKRPADGIGVAEKNSCSCKRKHLKTARERTNCIRYLCEKGPGV